MPKKSSFFDISSKYVRPANMSFQAKALKKFSVVVTRFSISDDSFASCKTIALIKTPWFGIKSPAPFNSASALFAAIAFLSTAFVSSSAFAGSSGRLLYGVVQLERHPAAPHQQSW
jgi:hypothetical protein